MTTTARIGNVYTMTTSKGDTQHGALAVRDTQAALRTFKGLQRAGVADAATVYHFGEPILTLGA